MNTIDQTSSIYNSDASTLAGDNFGVNVGTEVEQRMRAAARQARPFGLPMNVGRTDQAVRIGAGTALLAAAAFAPLNRGWRIGLSILGLAEIISGTTRYCPVSHALGVNTNGSRGGA